MLFARLASLHDTITLAHGLMDSVIRDSGEKGSGNKRKWEDNSKSNQTNKRQETTKVYVIGAGDKKAGVCDRPFCIRCK